MGDDKFLWKFTGSGNFDVHSFYSAICGNNAYLFPWKSFFHVMLLERVSFFLWLAGWGKILTIDNLNKRGLLLVNWCCMCRCSREMVDHLLIHYEIAHALWSEVFTIFGIQWVLLDKLASFTLVGAVGLGNIPWMYGNWC